MKKMEEYAAEIREWIRENMPSIPFFRIGGASVQTSESARNLGMIFDNSVEMSSHIKTVCRISFMQLNISDPSRIP